ncbi:MAG: TonB family protein [Pseudomonadota bacterium]
MNYVATTRRPNPAAMIGALGVPAAFGALLVAGLAIKEVTKDKEPRLTGVTIEPTPIEPPPTPEPSNPAEPSSAPQTQAPQVAPLPIPPLDFPTGPIIDVGPVGPLIDDFPIPTGPIDLGGAGIDPVPAMPDPIRASPRNSPGGWITDRDYKSRWIREGLSGNARFQLEIGASGRVTDCTVTGSTGHRELDTATCRLIADRARFNPAKDSSGNPTSGSYTSSVNWQIPD